MVFNRAFSSWLWQCLSICSIYLTAIKFYCPIKPEHVDIATTGNTYSDTMNIDLSFAHAYECEVADFMPTNSDPIYDFPDTPLIKTSRIVKVSPHHGDDWTGVFAATDSATNGCSGVHSHPDQNIICVVVHGDGYLVNVNTPTEFEPLAPYPIVAVLPLIERQQLLIALGICGAASGTRFLRGNDVS
jgi:hypothetical protein